MSSAREEILLCLVAIAESLKDRGLVETVTRIDTDIVDAKLPAITLLDGDEDVDLEIDRPNRPPDRPQIVHMIPHMLIRVKGPRAEVGSLLNEILAALVNAVMTDQGLRTLSKVKGGVKYHGLATDLAYGRAMMGELVPRFLIKYWLEPTKL